MSQSGKARLIMACSIVRWAPHAWLVIRLLALICAAPGIAPTIAHASPEAEPIAAMVARVSPAVVRIVSVRPHQPADGKAGAQVASATANEGTDTFTGSGFII